MDSRVKAILESRASHRRWRMSLPNCSAKVNGFSCERKVREEGEYCWQHKAKELKVKL